MSADRIYELIARRLSGEATADEEQELNAYLKEHAGDQYLYDILSKYWSQHAGQAQEEANDEEERFQRIIQGVNTGIEQPTQATEQIPLRKISRQKWTYYAAAASLLIVATLLFLFLNNKKTSSPAVAAKQPQLSEVSAKPGSRSKLILPDGTQVWLNAGSRITYLNTFNKALREVNLEGEAYFDVTHDASRPFIVHTSGIAIKVLGTAFTVKSYSTDRTIEATLLRGSIEVTKNNDPDAPKVILRPHEKLVYNKEKENIATQATNSDATTPASEETGISVTTVPKDKPDSILKETSWVYNKLVFDGDRFDELALRLERWYNVHITFKQQSLKQYRFKGTFENETIEQALEALKLTVPFDYTINGNDIEIYRK
jgi:ferric-dicitrate binding protein FerR (iron transport regulator)